MGNEMRLIDANATIELLRSLGNRDYRREKGTIADAIKMLLHPAYTPTVDAVEVVRCKDCTQYNGFGYCFYWEQITKGYGYCFEAERKNDV